MQRGPALPAFRRDSTSFELSPSTTKPKAQRTQPNTVPRSSADTRLLRPPRLDAETQRQFHRRLRLCCLIALVPLAFLFVSSLTNFIELIGREAVGVTGTYLCSGVLVMLVAVSIWMFRVSQLTERTLRLLEIIVFGGMALFFAYWQFNVQTGMPEEFFKAIERREVMRDPGTRLEPIRMPDAARNDTEKPAEPVEPMPPVPVLEPPKEVPTKLLPTDVNLARETAIRTETVRDINAIHERLRVLCAALIVHFNWLFLMVFHAVLVPNTVSRGVGVTLALALVPLGIDGVVVASHESTSINAITLFAVALTLLGAGSGLAIFGTAKQAELQRQVESAREAVREMGQYRLRRKLGQGGMGEVYLAEHRLLKRPCALKRIHAKYLNSPDQIKRFEREVQATAKLRHPNTVEIYDYGVADDGTFYYVMEYLPGLSLEELVGRFGPLPADRVVHLLRQVCGALRESHEAGLVHRDIKPSNIVVFRAGSPHDQVKLVDFGLVHSLSESDKPDHKITRDGLIVGTPEYMSPEQASGGMLDGRSDLFSLGSVAYYLLTGREAFHRENPLKTLLAVVSDTPAPLSEFNPFVPDDVLAVLMKCLAKEPNLRFHSAADVEQALAHCSQAGHWTEERSNEWWDHHPLASPHIGTDLATLPLRESQV